MESSMALRAEEQEAEMQEQIAYSHPQPEK